MHSILIAFEINQANKFSQHQNNENFMKLSSDSAKPLNEFSEVIWKCNIKLNPFFNGRKIMKLKIHVNWLVKQPKRKAKKSSKILFFHFTRVKSRKHKIFFIIHEINFGRAKNYEQKIKWKT